MLTCISLCPPVVCAALYEQCQLLTKAACFSIHQVSQKAGAGYEILCSARVLVVTSFLPLDSPCQLDTILVDIKDLCGQRWVSAPCREMCGGFGLPTHCSGPFYPYSSVGKGQGRDTSLRRKSFSSMLQSVSSQCLTVDGNGLTDVIWFRSYSSIMQMRCENNVLGVFDLGMIFSPLKTQSIRLPQCQEGEGSGMKCSCWMCFYHPCCRWFAL